jgi:hypothetical protein
VLTVALAAERLLTTTETLTAELNLGRLRGFKVGAEWRTTEEDLLAFIGHPKEVAAKETAVHEAVFPPQVGLEWRKVPPFPFAWPRRAGVNPNDVTEIHDRGAFGATVPFRGRHLRIRIGFTQRTAAGMDKRERVNVFLESNSSLVPLVQFVGANDYKTTGRLASVIKVKEGRHLRPGQSVPAEYQDLPRCVYSEVVVGRNAARSVAVLAHSDDLTLMARHGLIRAQWKGLL